MEQKLRTVYRIDGDKETVVQMSELVVGDRFRMEEGTNLKVPGIWVAKSMPSNDKQGRWMIQAVREGESKQ